MRLRFKQDRPYNCGIFACMYVLSKYYKIHRLHPRFLEELARTRKLSGTTHEGIQEIFRHYKIRYTSGTGTISLIRYLVPLIVNFQFEDEGHYGVIIGWVEGEIHIWEPWRAKHFWINESDFDRIWFSRRYGSHWFLHPLDKAGDSC